MDDHRNRLTPRTWAAQGALAAACLVAALAPAQATAQFVPPPDAPTQVAPPPPPTDGLVLEPSLRVAIYQRDARSVAAAGLMELATPLPGLGQLYAHSPLWHVAIQYGILALAAASSFFLGGAIGAASYMDFGSSGMVGLTIGLPIALMIAKAWGVFDATRAAHEFNGKLKVELKLVPADWRVDHDFALGAYRSP